MAIWEKLNPRERLEAIGTAIIILGYLISLANFGFGGSVIALVAGIAVLVVVYLKVTNPSMAWPADPALINLVISGLAALFVLIGLLSWLGVIGFAGGISMVALLATVVGTALLVWGAWQEYAAVKPALPAFLSTGAAGTTNPSTSAPAAPPAAPSAPPPAPAPPPVTSSYDDRDETPPA